MSLPNEIWFEITKVIDNLEYALINEQFYQFFKIRYANITLIELKEYLSRRDISGYEYMKFLVDHNNKDIMQFLIDNNGIEPKLAQDNMCKHATMTINEAIKIFEETYNACLIEDLIDAIELLNHRKIIFDIEKQIKTVCKKCVDCIHTHIKELIDKKIDILSDKLENIPFSSLLTERMQIPKMCMDKYGISCEERVRFNTKYIDEYDDRYGFILSFKRYFMSILPDSTDYDVFPTTSTCMYLIDIVRNFPELELENNILNNIFDMDIIKNDNNYHLNYYNFGIIGYLDDISLYLGNIDLHIKLWYDPDNIISFYSKELFHDIISRLNNVQLILLVNSIICHRNHGSNEENIDIIAQFCEWLDMPKVTELIRERMDI